MQGRSWFWSFSPWLALGLASACGDSQDVDGYQAYCARSCQHLHECTASVDVAQCTQSCEDDYADVGPHLRQDYLAGIDQCAADLSCTELAVNAASGRCAREARAKVSASATAVSLCGAVDDSIQECLGVSLGTAGCIEAVKILTDTALLSATPCFDKPCDRRASCLSDTVGVALIGN